MVYAGVRPSRAPRAPGSNFRGAWAQTRATTADPRSRAGSSSASRSRARSSASRNSSWPTGRPARSTHQTSERSYACSPGPEPPGVTVILVTEPTSPPGRAAPGVQDGRVVEGQLRQQPRARVGAPPRMNTFAALRSAWRALAANSLRNIPDDAGHHHRRRRRDHDARDRLGRGATESRNRWGLGSNIMLVLPGAVTQQRRAPGRADRPVADGRTTRARSRPACPRSRPWRSFAAPASGASSNNGGVRRCTGTTTFRLTIWRSAGGRWPGARFERRDDRVGEGRDHRPDRWPSSCSAALIRSTRRSASRRCR